MIPRLFADDTCLIVKSLNSKLLQNEMNTELEKLPLWCCANKLNTNPTNPIYKSFPQNIQILHPAAQCHK